MSSYTREAPASLRWRCDCGTVNVGPIDQKCDTCLSHHPSVAERMTPVADDNQPETPMPVTKECQRSGREFVATGNNQKFCGKCDDCKAKTPAPAKKAEKPKAETKRKVVNTGYTPTRATTTSDGDYDEAIDQLETILAKLDARREKIQNALDALREAA